MQTSRAYVSPENEERGGWHTLIQENLFPAIVKGLLRILVLFALEDRCERGHVLSHRRNQSVLMPANPKFEYLGVAHKNLGLAIALLDRAWP